MAAAAAMSIAFACQRALLLHQCPNSLVIPAAPSHATRNTTTLTVSSLFRSVILPRQRSTKIFPLCCIENSSDATAFLASEGIANIDAAAASSTSQAQAQPQVQFDLTLPRRRLLAEFTCDSCGTRSQRLINPDAYERGTVFVQCSGCEVYHKLVDNLHLVQEYDFRNDAPAATDTSTLDPQDCAFEE
ncbi:hypothetical protein O6H91_04G057200 [Diphasiastrum complanatum]|uniref:Uncharacterized protein n=2 Tax=Diphasiastrum complanatum TaxID=34168 RepID=A0ACC2B1X8_DIPCM|nr:hypothetical protein O6H91_18G047100 [Diphasiastrum complanatum]KAJ7558817.1 hypothetical protein O6H91_04G057200 [Diphasiastrum complanatum]